MMGIIDQDTTSEQDFKLTLTWLKRFGRLSRHFRLFSTTVIFSFSKHEGCCAKMVDKFKLVLFLVLHIHQNHIDQLHQRRYMTQVVATHDDRT